MSDLKPCPRCGGLPQIEGKGQIWRGVKGYSDPQYFQLIHHCKGIIPEDDFVTGSFHMRGRTEDQLITAWNTRAAPKVRQLEWRDVEAVELAKLSAYTPVGYYYADNCLFWGPGTIVSTGYQNIDQAKAAAQADYERRILSALTPETET